MMLNILSVPFVFFGEASVPGFANVEISSLVSLPSGCEGFYIFWTQVLCRACGLSIFSPRLQPVLLVSK